MQTYGPGVGSVDLYLWNTQITKAMLEDIQHFEVLLRNWFDTLLSPHFGAYWFDGDNHPSRLSFSRRDKQSVAKAITRAGGPSAPPGKIISELSFDFWWFLLGNRHATTIHGKIAKHFHYQHSVAGFKTRVETVYRQRNRCAHHEPVVKPNLAQEKAAVDRFRSHLEEAASWVSPSASLWISNNSRVTELYKGRP